MKSHGSQSLAATLMIGSLAGLAGGGVEVGWIALYGALTGTPAAPVARGIVQAVIPAWTASSYAVALGILVHLGLAVVLGNILALAIRARGRSYRTAPTEFAWVVSTLAAVWVINFFLVLPQLSPEFVHLLPYGTTMLSKLLFGVAAAAALRSGSPALRQQRSD